MALYLRFPLSSPLPLINNFILRRQIVRFDHHSKQLAKQMMVIILIKLGGESADDQPHHLTLEGRMIDLSG